MPNTFYKHSNRPAGFTIVELLIVVIVIAILAAITVVAFNGIQTRAIKSTLAHSISSTINRIEADKVVRGTYATTLANLKESTDSNTSDVTYQYTSDGNTFCLTATLKVFAMHASSQNKQSEDGVCEGHDEPITGPIPDPVVHTQKGSYDNGGVAYTNGVDYPVQIDYDLRPTDYVFVLFNADYVVAATMQDSTGTELTKHYEKSMGASGYQKHIAFGKSGLTGPQEFNIHTCNVYGYGCNGTSSYTMRLKATYIVYVLRGLGSNPIVAATSTSYGNQPRGTIVTPAAQTLKRGKLAIYSSLTYASYAPSFADASNPGLTWIVDSTMSSNVARDGIRVKHAYAQNSGTVQYDMHTNPTTGGGNYHGMVLFTFN